MVLPAPRDWQSEFGLASLAVVMASQERSCDQLVTYLKLDGVGPVLLVMLPPPPLPCGCAPILNTSWMITLVFGHVHVLKTYGLLPEVGRGLRGEL